MVIGTFQLRDLSVYRGSRSEVPMVQPSNNGKYERIVNENHI